MRIAFFGTSDFAVTILTALVDHGSRPVIVVTAPTRKSGRGLRIEEPPVATIARERGLTTFQPEKVNAPESRAVIAEPRADLFVVVAYGHVLGATLLAMPARGAVNIHGSLLPRYRGPAPVARAIENGESTTGVTLQFMVREVDAGDVIATRECRILPDDDAGSLSRRLAVLGAELLLEQLGALADGTAARVAQNPQEATYAPLLSKADGRIPWQRGANEVSNFVRAMSPWPGAFSEMGPIEAPQRIVVCRARALGPTSGATRPGEIVAAESELVVATGDGVVRIERLLRPGKREMSDVEFLRGVKLERGAVLR
jgi:methionyl-tRNA formyltransferase